MSTCNLPATPKAPRPGHGGWSALSRLDGFTAALPLVVLFAWVWPELGAQGGPLHSDLATRVGVALIFFLHGSRLSLRALQAGVTAWRLHALIQGSNFLLLPLIGLVVFWALGHSLLGNPVPAQLKLGLMFLCALPCALTSAVVLTAMARGNVATALFNSTLSNLLGIVFTPFWVSLVVSSTERSVPLSVVAGNLVVLLVVPLALGQLVGAVLRAARPVPWSAPLRRVEVPRLLKTGAHWTFKHIDRAVILFIIYATFCDSFEQQVWAGHVVGTLLTISLITVGLLGLALLSTWTLCRLFRLSAEDRACVVFCGSTKTLAAGVPMAAVIFASGADVSQILLPILLYQPLQLVVYGALAARWGSTAATRAASPT